MAKRIRRQRTQLPYCYFEGYLEKRSFKEKTSRKLWTCLCGNTLFFYSTNKDNDYAEKLDISTFISITDDYSCDRNLDAARFNLQLKHEEIKLTAPNPETRELWKAFIYSVVKLSLPSSLNLLPGQIHMLKEAIEQEMKRIQTLSPPPAEAESDTNIYIKPTADMPACYHKVSRTEAQIMLERNPEKGNMLLRPGRDGNSFAVTTRQYHNGSVFRHYRVARKGEGGFSIDVEDPVSCSTLHQVINYLVEKTDGILIPFEMETTYDGSITFIKSNEENGEKSVQCTSSTNVTPSPPYIPPKPVFQAPSPNEQEFETVERLYLNDQRGEKSPAPFRLPILVKSLPPLPRSSQPNGEYINTTAASEVLRRATKQPLMPPPRIRSSSSTTSSPDTMDGRERPPTLPLVPHDPLANELKQKLEKIRMLKK